MEVLTKFIGICQSPLTSLMDLITKHVTYPFKVGNNVKALQDASRNLEERTKDVAMQIESAERKGLIAKDQPPPLIPDMPSTSNASSQIDSNLQEALRYLKEDDTVTRIGIWGMGGVGKTHLLKQIQNSFYHGNSIFDVVILVTASKECSVSKVQDEIIKKLGLRKPNDVQSNAKTISNFLAHRSFLLLLDDLWGYLDLEAVGVPIPLTAIGPYKQKVVLTTRSDNVCGVMSVEQQIKVQKLDEVVAWSLFQKNVGEQTLSSDTYIPTIAKEIVKELGGLPLALITIGSSMHAKKNYRSWEWALELLRESRLPEIKCGRLLIESVKMHDVLRDMALWIARDYGENSNKWIVKTDVGQAENISNDAERIAAFDALIYLDLEKVSLKEFPVWRYGAFSKLHALRVLDLFSNWGIGYPPSLLKELKSLNNLRALGITAKGDFQFQSLEKSTNMPIQSLGIYNLKKPTLSLMGNILQKLNHFEIWDSGTQEILIQRSGQNANSHLDLEILRLTSMEDLKSISWTGVSPKDVFPKLRRLEFFVCHKIENASWIVHLPCLRELYINACFNVKYVICSMEDNHGENSVAEIQEEGGGALVPTFPCLQIMKLINLPELYVVCDPTVTFPSLRYLHVEGCEK
ncbi:LOW QUALITY PROTEIN: probable disease resistance protein At4g14610 [Typha latifolia]|uniref:LOW QUALITY PROTEIN: probable disease resistance protein At4g14610 n=1 Tax=Typha latifolia TaxID=4733 RepID=UPI003C30A731